MVVSVAPSCSAGEKRSKMGEGMRGARAREVETV
jgi:hypothetical protein